MNFSFRNTLAADPANSGSCLHQNQDLNFLKNAICLIGFETVYRRSSGRMEQAARRKSAIALKILCFYLWVIVFNSSVSIAERSKQQFRTRTLYFSRCIPILLKFPIVKLTVSSARLIVRAMELCRHIFEMTRLPNFVHS